MARKDAGHTEKLPSELGREGKRVVVMVTRDTEL